MNTKHAIERIRTACRDKERLGKFGEKLAQMVFLRAGFTYIALCQLDRDGAPMAVTPDGGSVLPDYDVPNLTAYIDAKAKTQSVLWRQTGTPRHGINKTAYEDYRQAGYVGRREAGLLIVEMFQDDGDAWSGAILAGSFRYLGKPSVGFNEQPQKVYWNRDRFALIDTITPQECVELSRGTTYPRDCSEALSRVFAPKPPKCDYHKYPDVGEYYHETRNGKVEAFCVKCGAWVGKKPVGENR